MPGACNYYLFSTGYKYKSVDPHKECSSTTHNHKVLWKYETITIHKLSWGIVCDISCSKFENIFLVYKANMPC
jgi:hypothetical protein